MVDGLETPAGWPNARPATVIMTMAGESLPGYHLAF